MYRKSWMLSIKDYGDIFCILFLINGIKGEGIGRKGIITTIYLLSCTST